MFHLFKRKRHSDWAAWDFLFIQKEFVVFLTVGMKLNETIDYGNLFIAWSKDLSKKDEQLENVRLKLKVTVQSG